MTSPSKLYASQEKRWLMLEDLIRGDIILVRGHWYMPLSMLIQLFTRGPYSHTACYVGNGQIVEACAKGVVVSPLIKYQGRYDVVRMYGFPQDKVQKAVDWMLEQRGAGYDYFGLIGIALAMLGKEKTNTLDNPKRFWCSELVADGMLKSGLELDIPESTYRVSPNDLYRLLTK